MSAAANLDAACEALFSMKSDMEHDEWIRIGMSAKAAGLSFDDFNAWSCSAGNYGGKRATSDVWDSFKSEGGITEKSLFYFARKSGWRGPANDVCQEDPKRRSATTGSANIARIWAESAPAYSAHPYICSKQGEATNLREVVTPLKGWGRYSADDLKGWLVVPVLNQNDRLMSLQFIAPDGRKLNAWGCKMDGTFTLGSISPEQTVYVVEGVGHAWSLHRVTGNPCIVSFGLGNIAKAVARVQVAGGRPIIIPDRGAEQHALSVAARMGCRYAVLPEDLPLKRDVNDLFVEHGSEAVEQVLANIITPEPANDNGFGARRDDTRRRLQQAENALLQHFPFSIMPPVLSVEDMVEDCVWITTGSQVGSLREPGRVLPFSEFKDLTAASSSVLEAGGEKSAKPTLHANAWRRRDDRKTVITRTFRAGASALCYDPDGLTAFNSWRPMMRWESEAEISPFLEHIDYLFADKVESDAFLDWLAHLEQKPEELPHYGWLHIADNTGTGRNWLSSLLARVWRGYVAPNVDLPALLESSFNGQLAGRILAIVDEVQEGGGENPYRHSNRLKSLVNAEYRDINPKFGRQYREHNSCRWLVFSNHQNALPLNDSDRRWRVIHHDAAPRSPDTYRSLYAMLNDAEFINAVGAYLKQRDIRNFNPGERPPMSKAKLAAVDATKSLMLQSAEQLVGNWPVDVITNADIAEVLSDGNSKPLDPAMRRAMSDAGAIQYGPGKVVKVRGKAERCWILRSANKWIAAPPLDVGSEAARARELVRSKSAISILAGISEFAASPF